MKKAKVKGRSVQKTVEGNGRADEQMDRGDCITFHANVVGNEYIWGMHNTVLFSPTTSSHAVNRIRLCVETITF